VSCMDCDFHSPPVSDYTDPKPCSECVQADGFKKQEPPKKDRRQTDMKWRVKYWRWINEQAGEWYRTGLMTKENAEKVAESFRQSHEQVEVYYDDGGG
jgi:hypothetical protein